MDRWQVLWLPEARRELAKLPQGERMAVTNAALKLEAMGPMLGYPHSSDVRGADRLRELRPRGGRSPWRAFYRQAGPEAFVIAGGRARGDGRWPALRPGGGGSHGPPGRTRGRGGVMKLSELAATNEVLAEELKDPEFAQEWDKTTFARAVAERVLRYRTDQQLTQTQLARKAGTVQSVIARLESGEQAPSLATLARLSQRLGIEFHIEITPSHVQLSA